MTQFIINIDDGTDRISVEPDVSFQYTDSLNEVNEAELKFSSLGTVERGLMVMGNYVEILRDGTIEFYGLVDHIDYLEGGGVVVHASGYETWLAKENGAYSSSPWKNTASATIFSSLIGESTHLSADTIEAGLSIDFKANRSESLWNVIGNLAKKTGQDIEIDYSDITDVKVNILDDRGSTTSVATLNSGVDIKNIRYTLTYPAGNKIIVYGKGDGSEQIKSEYPSHGYDATSQTTYGVIECPVIDRTIISVNAANTLADKEVALKKDPAKIYFFDVLNPDFDVQGGDVLTLNAEDMGLSSESVRIVNIKRGLEGTKEFLKLEVTNTAYSKLIKRRDRYFADVAKVQRDEATVMQGSGNLSQWGGMKNGNSSVPLRINFVIDTTYFQDEAGNIRVSALTLDYDVDPYHRETGPANFVGSDPPVNNTSDNNSALTIVAETVSNWASAVLDRTSTPTWFKIGDYNNISVHGDSIFFFMNAKITNQDDLTDDIQLAVRAYNNDTGEYYPSSIGIVFFDGHLQYSGTSGSESSHSHNHRHQPSDLSSFLTTDGTSSFTDYDNTSGSSHSHSVTIDTQENANMTILCPVDPYGDDWEIQVAAVVGSIGNTTTADFNLGYHIQSRHEHDSGTYDVAQADLDYITIQDQASDLESLNASNVVIYLDYWNGSSWVNKHSITPSPSATIDTDVDLTNGGTYPDNTGLWRVRIYTNNAAYDFLQGIVKVKHVVDN